MGMMKKNADYKHFSMNLKEKNITKAPNTSADIIGVIFLYLIILTQRF